MVDAHRASPEASEFEVALEEAMAEEEQEEEPAEELDETETAIEAELEAEDRVAVGEEAVVEALLRDRGVLPEEAEIEPVEESELPAPLRPGEFLCSSCFLIKPSTQLGDAGRRICRDCLDPPDATHA